MLASHQLNPVNNLQPMQAKYGITEIVLPDSHDLSMVMPSLAFLSNQHYDRWLTWICDTPKLDRQQLQGYGFNLSHIRVIYPRDNEHGFWLFWEALAEGNSHTVIGKPGLLTDPQLARLESGARAGQCSGLVLRDRGKIAH